MKLTKLQSLAEAVPTGIKAEIDQLQRLFDNMEGSIMSVEKWAEGQLLANALKRHGHPATESKAFRDAVKKMYGEFEELKMALIMPLQSKVDEAVAAPAKEKSLEELKAEKKTIDKIMRGIEQHLDSKNRYKEWDSDAYAKSITYVTQESTPELGKEAAKTIAKLLRKAGIKGWTLRVTVRDDYRGNEDTKWQAKVKL